MRVKSNIYQCRFDCPRCLEVDEKVEEVEETDESEINRRRPKHCHCPLWQPSSLLVESMGSGQPSRRYKEDLRKKKEDLEGDMVQKKLGEEIAARKRKQVIRESQDRLKSRLQKQKNTKAITVPGKAGEKRKKKENKEKRVKEKRARLSFLQ